MDKQTDCEDDKTIIAASGYSVSQLSDKDIYGATKGYERKLYDSTEAKKLAHDRAFGDNKTIKDQNGTVLHRSHKAAQKKYGQKKYSAHSGEADHIDPLKKIHDRHKDDLFLTDEDIKEIANRDGNFQIISKSKNASKGDRSEIELALDKENGASIPQRLQQARCGVNKQVETDILLRIRQAKNIGKEFTQGASDALAASAIPLVIRGTQDLVKVANGELSVADAAKDVGTLGVSIAASGGGVRIASYALGQVLKDSTNPAIKAFAKTNQIGTVLIAGSIIVGAAGKYLSGEINAEDFFLEISKDGASLIGGMLASETMKKLLTGAVGLSTTAAPVLAAMIASAVCSEIYEQTKRLREEKKDNKEIRKISDQACASIQTQKNELKNLLEKDHEQWAQQMTDIFQIIASGITTNDVTQTNRGLRELLKVYNKEISLYESSDELAQGLLDMRNGRLKGLV